MAALTGPGQRYANVSTADGRLETTHRGRAEGVVEFGTSTGESGSVWTPSAKPKGISIGPRHRRGSDRRRSRTSSAGLDDLITIIEGDGHETVKQHKAG
jgi:hypothetical protein